MHGAPIGNLKVTHTLIYILLTTFPIPHNSPIYSKTKQISLSSSLSVSLKLNPKTKIEGSKSNYLK